MRYEALTRSDGIVASNSKDRAGVQYAYGRK